MALPAAAVLPVREAARCQGTSVLWHQQPAVSLEESPRAKCAAQLQQPVPGQAGDIADPNLTEAQRRMLRRRRANRNSAQRVRERRDHMLHHLQAKVSSTKLFSKQEYLWT